jgi:hypothetical protein
MSQDILSSIDAAVGNLCACGCDQPLDPNGASAWYATPECQRSFLERQTTDPHDVYNRPDAAEAYVGVDHMQVPLSDPDGMHWLRRRYLQAPPSAHAPGVLREEYTLTDEQMEATLFPRLVPVPNGPDQYREWLNGLRPGSLTEEPLRRLEWGTLRSPLSRNISDISPDAYWPSEPSTVQQWIEANPTVTERVDPTPIASWAESQGLHLEPWQRSMLDAIYSPRAPEPPSPQEVMDNVRRFMSLITNGPTFVGNPETVGQVHALPGGHELEILVSDVVPDNQIIAIDNAEIERMRREAFANISLTPFDVAGFREGMRTFAAGYTQALRAAWGPIRTAFEGLAESMRQVAPIAEEILAARRARMHYLHSLYRQRCLARRRRNR